MIKSVTVVNHLGESLKLDLASPEKSGFIVKSIEGLGPVKATVNTTKMSTTDGALYNSARVDERNIVLRLEYMLKETVEEVRHLSYKYFPIKKQITFIVETEKRKCAINGYVESNEPDIFNKQSGCQISIICPYPYFHDANGKQETVFSGIVPLFEFKFPSHVSLESGTYDLIEFGRINNMDRRTIYYSGESDAGISIELHALGSVINPSIFNANTREYISIDTTKLELSTGNGITAGDTIYINTAKGQKSVLLDRGGNYYNILNCIGAKSSWMQLSKGDNVFVYTSEYGTANLQLKISNYVLYEGV